GLRDAEREQTQELPAGIRQRAGLALSTLHRPHVLFLDEPTAGVDVRSRALFWDLIQEEAAGGVTVFVTTHFLEEGEYCDWVSFIADGRLIADATPEELRRRFADGYRIAIAGVAGAEATLRAAGLDVRPQADGLAVTVPALDARVLAVLEQLAEAHAGARI